MLALSWLRSEQAHETLKEKTGISSEAPDKGNGRFPVAAEQE